MFRKDFELAGVKEQKKCVKVRDGLYIPIFRDLRKHRGELV